MSKLTASFKREPVRWFTGLDAAIAYILSGIMLFSEWDPSPDQVVYILGVPTTLAAIFGITLVRNAVTPNEKLSDVVVDLAAKQ